MQVQQGVVMQQQPQMVMQGVPQQQMMMVQQQPQQVVMMQAAPQQQMAPQPPQEWRYGLFSCFDNIGTCCYGYLCTFCLIGDNGAKLGRSCFADCLISGLAASFLGGDCIVTSSQRADIRRKANLKESCCGDCLVGWCCWGCAACQHANEIKYRQGQGVNMA